MRRRLAVTAALVATAPFAPTGLRDAVTGGPALGVTLERPTLYVVFAPFCELADAIAALPLHTHYALMATVLATGALWPSAQRPRSVRAISVRAVTTLSALLAIYVGAVLVPRPVARFVASDPDDVVVDFHSHTSASHDGRAGHDAVKNRAWHTANGFDVAYVTDHSTFAGVRDAARANPSRAGDGVVLLAGVECRHVGQHLNVLGTTPNDSAAYATGELSAESYASLSREGAAPVALLTVPAKLYALPTQLRLDAIELSDAAPRGLEQGDRNRTRILAIADSLGLAVVAGSDNHGWATNAVAWSVMRIPGWRTMTPDSLDRAIRETIHTRGRDAVRVVERRAPIDRGSSLASPMDEFPRRLWALGRALTWPERLMWMAWLWIPLALSARGPFASRVSRALRASSPRPRPLH